MNRFIRFPALLYPLFLTLSLAQVRVLWVIVRQTIGWQKTHDAISLNQFQHGIGKEPGTGMSRTHVITAIRSLELLGIIRVVRQVSADGISLTSIYSLAERFLLAGAPTIEMSTAALEAMGKRRGGGVSSGHHEGSLDTRPTINNDISKETSSSQDHLEENHDDDSMDAGTVGQDGPLPSPAPEEIGAPVTVESEAMAGVDERAERTPTQCVEQADMVPARPSETVLPVLEMPAPSASSAEGAAVDAVAVGTAVPVLAEAVIEKHVEWPPVVSSSFGGSQEGMPVPVFATRPAKSMQDLAGGLPGRLLNLGFSARCAQEIMVSYPPERVSEALDNLPHRKARNPAGYLLRELQAGDFVCPEAVGRKPGRRPIGLPPRTMEVPQAQAQKEAVESDRIREAIAGLDPETRAGFWQEAKGHCARFGRKSVPEDSPMLQAQFELIVLTRVLGDGQEARCA